MITKVHLGVFYPYLVLGTNIYVLSTIVLVFKMKAPVLYIFQHTISRSLCGQCMQLDQVAVAINITRSAILHRYKKHKHINQYDISLI
jgi:hypothetical protein